MTNDHWFSGYGWFLIMVFIILGLVGVFSTIGCIVSSTFRELFCLLILYCCGLLCGLCGEALEDRPAPREQWRIDAGAPCVTAEFASQEDYLAAFAV